MWENAFDADRLEKEIKVLEEASGDPHLWDDQERAKRVMRDLSSMREELLAFRSLETEVNDVLELARMTSPEDDASGAEEIKAKTKELATRVEQAELKMFLDGPYDKEAAIVTIYAGAGGVDAQDFAQMLERMYLRWAELKDFPTQIIDESLGEEAGIKSVTFTVEGRYAYGSLVAERGVHRLVRMSPFNSAHSRETSFAQVDVLPDVAQDTSVEIDPSDLRIDTYRASGAGGQHVNKTDSAVRITHIPTNTVVACQSERSQAQNKEHAMRVLRAKLVALKEEQALIQQAKIRGAHKETAWGNQIRSYVMQPYTIVKDHRTKHEVGDVEKVLNGGIDSFIENYLRWNRLQS